MAGREKLERVTPTSEGKRMRSPDPSIFISYRRADSGAAVRALASTLRQAFGSSQVFVDTEAIRTGDQWQESIRCALESASIVIVAIGPAWLRVADEYGRRRLDIEDDWVRSEVQHAVTHEIKVVPLLLSKASPQTRRLTHLHAISS